MAGFERSVLLEKYEGCFHAVTTKVRTLCSQGSMALHTGEPEDEVVANRQEIAKRLGIGQQAHFVVAEQTHSDHIAIIKRRESRGWYTAEDAIADCDAMITDQKGVVLTILTADCVPVLLYDPKKAVVAAIHAGWKGTRAQITEKTVQKMVETFGSDPKEIVAFIAPSIGRCCYEAREDVAQHFLDEQTFDRVGENYMLDLPLINQKQLLAAGLNVEHIERCGQCTSCEVERYFSYRKEQGCSGRFMSMIALR